MTDREFLKRLKIAIACDIDRYKEFLDAAIRRYEEIKGCGTNDIRSVKLGDEISYYQRLINQLGQYLVIIDERLRNHAPREQKPNN